MVEVGGGRWRRVVMEGVRQQRSLARKELRRRLGARSRPELDERGGQCLEVARNGLDNCKNLFDAAAVGVQESGRLEHFDGARRAVGGGRRWAVSVAW